MQNKTNSNKTDNSPNIQKFGGNLCNVLVESHLNYRTFDEESIPIPRVIPAKAGIQWALVDVGCGTPGFPLSRE